MSSVVDFKTLGGRAAANEARRGGGGGGGDGTKPEWMHLKGANKVRPVGHAVELVKFFVKTPGGNRSVVVNPEDKDKAAAMLSEKAGYEVKPQTRFAMNIIDRKDGRVKILEAGMKVFGVMAQWSSESGIHPGSSKGWDWTINVAGEGLGTSYTVYPTTATVLSDDEKALNKQKNDQYSLDKIYEAVSLDKLIDRVFSERKQGGGPNNEPQPNSAPQSNTPQGKSNSDDPVDW